MSCTVVIVVDAVAPPTGGSSSLFLDSSVGLGASGASLRRRGRRRLLLAMDVDWQRAHGHPRLIGRLDIPVNYIVGLQKLYEW